jgi:type II secretory pathway component PulF
MATGRLDRTLSQLTEYMEKTAETKGKLKSAFAYPLFMLGFLTIVFFLMVFKILPTFQNLFASFGNRLLPLPTRMMITAGHLVSSNLHWILIAAGLITAVVIFVLKHPAARFYWDRFKLRLPLVGELMKKGSMGKFLRAFAVLTQSEVLILDSLNLVASAGYNRYLEARILQASQAIERGASVAGAFQRTGFFPDIVIQMISSGEETGELGDLLESAANFYEDQVDATIRSIVALINPVITVLVGGMIGLMMISVFLPIFELGGAIRGR